MTALLWEFLLYVQERRCFNVINWYPVSEFKIKVAWTGQRLQTDGSVPQAAPSPQLTELINILKRNTSRSFSEYLRPQMTSPCTMVTVALNKQPHFPHLFPQVLVLIVQELQACHQTLPGFSSAAINLSPCAPKHSSPPWLTAPGYSSASLGLTAVCPTLSAFTIWESANTLLTTGPFPHGVIQTGLKPDVELPVTQCPVSSSCPSAVPANTRRKAWSMLWKTSSLITYFDKKAAVLPVICKPQTNKWLDFPQCQLCFQPG